MLSTSGQCGTFDPVIIILYLKSLSVATAICDAFSCGNMIMPVDMQQKAMFSQPFPAARSRLAR